MNQNHEEYLLLTEKLETIEWALEGSCYDIDCDKYMYKDLLKNKYKPVLEHNFSCVKKLKVEKNAIMRLLSMKKFIKYRYKKCGVCRKLVDSLGSSYLIVSFTKLLDNNYTQWNGIGVHKMCSKKVKIPKGWKKFL